MIDDVKKSLKQMSGLVLEMVNLVYEGFMKNDAHFLNSALNKERIIDDLEKEVTADIIQMMKTTQKSKQKEIIILSQIVQNLERMGDELRSLIERIEIKIAERLLFSEIGLKQYEEVFKKMQGSVSLTIKFLAEDDEKILNSILKNGTDIKLLIEKYRIEHLERLTNGMCEPRAANMYFDMLDFTGNIARHCTNIARAYKGK